MNKLKALGIAAIGAPEAPLLSIAFDPATPLVLSYDRLVHVVCDPLQMDLLMMEWARMRKGLKCDTGLPLAD